LAGVGPDIEEVNHGGGGGAALSAATVPFK
jgi:hypothetical protein